MHRIKPWNNSRSLPAKFEWKPQTLTVWQYHVPEVKHLPKYKFRTLEPSPAWNFILADDTCQTLGFMVFVSLFSPAVQPSIENSRFDIIDIRFSDCSGPLFCRALLGIYSPVLPPLWTRKGFARWRSNLPFCPGSWARRQETRNPNELAKFSIQSHQNPRAVLSDDFSLSSMMNWTL